MGNGRRGPNVRERESCHLGRGENLVEVSYVPPSRSRTNRSGGHNIATIFAVGFLLFVGCGVTSQTAAPIRTSASLAPRSGPPTVTGLWKEQFFQTLANGQQSVSRSVLIVRETASGIQVIPVNAPNMRAHHASVDGTKLKFLLDVDVRGKSYTFDYSLILQADGQSIVGTATVAPGSTFDYFASGNVYNVKWEKQ